MWPHAQDHGQLAYDKLLILIPVLCCGCLNDVGMEDSNVWVVKTTPVPSLYFYIFKHSPFEWFYACAIPISLYLKNFSFDLRNPDG